MENTNGDERVIERPAGDIYGLQVDSKTGYIQLDGAYGEYAGALVSIDPNDDTIGIVQRTAGGDRPTNTKVPMKKRTRPSNKGHIPVSEPKLEVSKVTVVKIVKKNTDEKDDHWNYDYQFRFEMFASPSLINFVLTLKHKQNGKEHQFDIEKLNGKKVIEITLTNEDTSLFDITKTVMGENSFDVIISIRNYSKSFEDVITDFTVDLSDLNLIQKGRYGIQRNMKNVKE